MMDDAANTLGTELSQECQDALEAWLSDEDSLRERERHHLESCSHCQEQRRVIQGDQRILEKVFRSTAVPAPPALTLRGPLQSASGYPRRVSLALMPLFLALILLTCLAVIMLGWLVVKLERDQLAFQTRNETLQVRVAVKRAQKEGHIRMDPGTRGILYHTLKASHAFLPFRIDEETLLLDPYSHPFQLRRIGAEALIYSVGANGIDEGGRGDDITSRI